MAQDLEYLVAALALSRVPNVGPVHYRRLLDAFGGPAEALAATFEQLVAINGIGTETAKAIKNFNGWELVKAEIKTAEGKGISFVTPMDSLYPLTLGEIYDPPPVLYCAGSAAAWPEVCVAVVGTRTLSQYGRRATRYIVRGLVEAGVGIVSGMARGADSAAHEAALEAGGFTAAVLGCGVDIVYPPENKKLYREILSSGFVLSEYPLGTPPERKNFPRRNRIISGISRAVVITEAPLKSGALITAAHALEQNRAVFALPGSIFSSKSRGSLWLLNQGAVALFDPNQILEEISPQVAFSGEPPQRTPTPEKELEPPVPDELPADERAVLRFLSDKPLHIDEIGRALKIEAGRLSRIMTYLEINGFAKQLPGKYFVREY